MSVRIELANYDHVDCIARNMRRDDQIEVWLSHMMKPRQALLYSLNSIRAWTVMANGVPFCMFGVAETGILGNSGAPWLLSTDEIANHKRELLHYSRLYTEGMKTEFSVLENYVHADNKQSIRWLKWLGYEMVEKVSYGHKQAPFWRFRMET